MYEVCIKRSDVNVQIVAVRTQQLSAMLCAERLHTESPTVTYIVRKPLFPNGWHIVCEFKSPVDRLSRTN